MIYSIPQYIIVPETGLNVNSESDFFIFFLISQSIHIHVVVKCESG
jgi:hypothetical protein